MAGIGFELRRILRRRTYLALIQAYTYSGIVSSGPWLLSIFGILLLGFLALGEHHPSSDVIQFQVSVTYLIMSSLIFTGPVQLLFTRYVADMLFARERKIVISVIMLMLAGVCALGGILAYVLAICFFSGTSLLYQWLMGIAFVELCGVWILTIMSTSLKDYKALVMWYLIAYGVVVIAGFYLGENCGLSGYLLAFDVGQSILLVSLGVMIILQFPGIFQFPGATLNKHRIFWLLVLVGLFFNAAVWADKLLFWFTPATSGAVIGPLRASPIYDVPIFLSYLLIIPGLAMFLFRLETDFVEAYDAYNRAIVEGGRFPELIVAKQGMINATRAGLWDIAKVQGITVIFAIAFTPKILTLLGYPLSYARIFQFDVVGVSLQLLFMSILNVYFYMDLRRRSVLLTCFFLFGNIIFTWLTLQEGPFFYGMGFMFSLFIVDIIGLFLLQKDLQDIDFITFVKNH
ncbi:MAG: exopolysaccharide Pel transporter PelG [Sideroxydans sp.]|uniref:exopolysaccharide Pel transporter PelG n=1 Tax=Acidithiobacillus ferrooxidans TaxID=920 RepID=UPI000A40C872|nr:exopolysaccharide Pel transporter PelG [Acidithiobacillus ferrooxidans]MDD5470795.1 exopolysaccharide Pel transporter PelG [Sideroxydans sp.]